MSLLKYLFIIFFTFIINSSCVFAGARIKEASVVHLSTLPEKFKGSKVIINGYAKEQGGFLWLYLSKEDALMANKALAIRVYDNSKKRNLIKSGTCNNGFVRVVGVFDIIDRIGFYGIKDVEDILRYDLSDPRKDKICWENDDMTS